MIIRVGDVCFQSESLTVFGAHRWFKLLTVCSAAAFRSAQGRSVWCRSPLSSQWLKFPRRPCDTSSLRRREEIQRWGGGFLRLPRRPQGGCGSIFIKKRCGVNPPLSFPSAPGVCSSSCELWGCCCLALKRFQHSAESWVLQLSQIYYLSCVFFSVWISFSKVHHFIFRLTTAEPPQLFTDTLRRAAGSQACVWGHGCDGSTS